MTRLDDVNTKDVLSAIRLGCETMQRVFNADDDDIPFFGATVRPVAEMRFSAVHGESHVPGRHLNAVLNAEDAAGVDIDGAAVEKHARAAFFSYSGAVPLPLNRAEVGGPLRGFRAHNVREGFHALYALSKFRDSEKAREVAEASISAIFELWDPTHEWDVERLTGEYGLTIQPDQSFIVGLARAIGPLVKYYRATRYGPALELALLLKETAITEFYTEEGSYDPETFGTHAHSVTCVMSSLAQLADLTRDSNLMRRVKAFYDNGLWDLRDETGWSGAGAGRRGEERSDQGEVNNSGDILETALILGRWGYTEYYEDAERILRCHVLPSQLRNISFIDEISEDGTDGKRDVAARLRGAWGFPAPYGHEPIGLPGISFNLDVVGGTVGSLCEAYRDLVEVDESGVRVNMLFDHDTDDVHVESPYTHPSLRVTPKRAAPLFVRQPTWVERDQLRVTGSDSVPLASNGYLLFAAPVPNRAITLELPLALREIVLRHRSRDIRVRLRGDAVAAMESFGADLTFFGPL